MSNETVEITMTSFARFILADAQSKMAQARSIRHQYEDGYRQSSDHWRYLRSELRDALVAGGPRSAVKVIPKGVREKQRSAYESACAGMFKFWGRKHLQLIGEPEPRHWTYGRLDVKVNPEWQLDLDGVETVLKLYLKRDLTLTKRLADPLLSLMAVTFDPEARGMSMGVLDVHRGKLFSGTAHNYELRPVLEMQAAAFLVGWEAAAPGASAA
jgi:hypothetical protein